MRTIQRDIASAVLFSKDGKIFLGLRDRDRESVYPGLWGIPGGGIEEGEDQRSALNREIKEETGIDITPYPAELIERARDVGEKKLKGTGERVLCEMEFYTYKVVVAEKTASESKITLEDEHTEYRWFDPFELQGLDLPEPSTKLFKQMGYIRS